MEWKDWGIFLKAHPLGENKRIYTFFTHTHGIHKGLYHNTQRLGQTLLLGSVTELCWRARTEEQLGTWFLEEVFPPIMGEHPLSLSYLRLMALLLSSLLPERTPEPSLFHAWMHSVPFFSQPQGVFLYGCWENHLLETLGYGGGPFPGKLPVSPVSSGHPRSWIMHLSQRQSFFTTTWPQLGHVHKARLCLLQTLVRWPWKDTSSASVQGACIEHEKHP